MTENGQWFQRVGPRVATEHKTYDGTVARVAGNIMSCMATTYGSSGEDVKLVARCVQLARAIVAEVTRTEPEA